MVVLNSRDAPWTPSALMPFPVLSRVVPLAALSALILLGMGPATAAQGSPKLEYQVKAAFLLNFAKFVEWPTKAFALPTDPITICIVGRDPFAGRLARIVAGEKIDSREIITRSLPADGGVSACQVVFISTAEQNRYQQVLAKAKDFSILTVGETPGFADNGGMIEFVIDEEKVHFFINSGATELVGLKVSSRLLRVAKEVKNAGS